MNRSVPSVAGKRDRERKVMLSELEGAGVSSSYVGRGGQVVKCLIWPRALQSVTKGCNVH